MDLISAGQLFHLMLLWTGIALFGNVTTQIAKTPLRIAWKRRVTLKGDSLALYTWAVRCIPIGFCTVVGLSASIWPTWVQPTWGMILGSTAGCFSVVVYHAAVKAIPRAIAVLPEVLRKRLGG